ncbi:regulator of microtubule dynamics protein 1 isoform 2-T2 [Discoglossus pictus]
MAAVTLTMLRSWVQRCARSLQSRADIRSRPYAWSSSTSGVGKFNHLDRFLVLSSLTYVTYESYKRIREQTVVHASIRVEDIKEQADYLYGSGETAKLYELLIQYNKSEDDELLWRLARATRDLAQLSTTKPDEKKRLVYESFDYAKNALAKNESNSAAHKWYGICLSDVGDYEGMKVKIGNAYKIREHFQRAVELNPKDATALHLIGVWCYSFADLPWYQAKIASALFATPPSSSFEEALIYFHMAEEVDPNFYSKNLVYLGKSYLKLNLKEEAIVWLTKAKQYPARSEEDQQVNKEAVTILKSFGDKS